MGGKHILAVAALLAAAGIVAAADPETECVVIVERAALYEEGHFHDQAHVIEWLEYGTPVMPAPIGDAGETVGIKYWSVKLENGRRGVLEVGSFGWFFGVSDVHYDVIVDRAALYEKGHYGDDDHVIDWLKYGMRVQAGPVSVIGGGHAEFSLVRLKDGREGFIKTGSFGRTAAYEITAEETAAYDEPGEKRICTLKKGDKFSAPELWIRSDLCSYWTLILTNEGSLAWVEAGDAKPVPAKGTIKTLNEKGLNTSNQGVCR